MVKRTTRLQGSKQKRDDEYYTLFQDIADEVSLYLPQLRGKRILCPCDWDESYNEEIVYKEEGYVLGRETCLVQKVLSKTSTLPRHVRK